jgi:hypothetical protein
MILAPFVVITQWRPGAEFIAQIKRVAKQLGLSVWRSLIRHHTKR